jgi:hypothetical protein
MLKVIEVIVDLIILSAIVFISMHITMAVVHFLGGENKDD